MCAFRWLRRNRGVNRIGMEYLMKKPGLQRSGFFEFEAVKT